LVHVFVTDLKTAVGRGSVRQDASDARDDTGRCGAYRAGRDPRCVQLHQAARLPIQFLYQILRDQLPCIVH